MAIHLDVPGLLNPDHEWEPPEPPLPNTPADEMRSSQSKEENKIIATVLSREQVLETIDFRPASTSQLLGFRGGSGLQLFFGRRWSKVRIERRNRSKSRIEPMTFAFSALRATN